MSASPQEFVGKWTEDAANSDSIEPMLKGMGVGWKIRRIVTMLKMVQQIEVDGNKLIVSNISKHKADSTVHLMNAGERVIETNRGDKVLDNCKFVPTNEYPLEIVAILPKNKGSTVDRRKIIDGGARFVQRLTYRFPEVAGETRPADIHMTRTFVRLDEDGQESKENAVEVLQNSEKKSIPSSPRPQGAPQQVSSSSSSSSSRSSPPPPSAVVAQPKPSSKKQVPVATVASATPAKMASEEDEESGENSPELWIVSIFSFMFATVLYGRTDLGGVGNLALVVIGTVFALSRALSRTAKGAQLFDQEGIRWSLFVLAIFGMTFTAFFLGGSPIAFGVAGLAVAFSRVQADRGTLLADLDDKQQWVLIAGMVAMSGSMLALDTPQGASSSNVWLAPLCFAAMVRYGMVYRKFLLDTRKDDAQKRSKDKDGSTLSVGVVSYRIVDDMYAQYKLKVSHEGMTWFVWRRFSQFDSLRHELRRVFGGGVLPQLPSKTWFSSLDEEFLEERVAELDGFMQALFDPSGLRAQVFKIAEAKKFLGVGQGRGVPTDSLKEEDSANSLKPSPEEEKELCETLKQAEEKFDKALSVGEGDGWKFLKNHQGVQCYMKEENGFTYTKGVGTSPYAPRVVAGFLADPEKRKMYDDLFLKDTLLKQADCAAVGKALGDKPVDVCDCKYVEFKSPFPMAVGARDVVMVNCRQVFPDDTVKVVMASPSDRFCKPKSKYIRAKVFAAGIKIEPNPAKPGESIVSNVQMMDPNGNIPGWIVKTLAPERAAMSAKINACIKSLPTPQEPIPAKAS